MGFACALVMGGIFVFVQSLEWRSKTYGIGASSYASLYFVTTGFHVAPCPTRSGGAPGVARLDRSRLFQSAPPPGRVGGVLYWHFVDVVWLFVFTTYY